MSVGIQNRSKDKVSRDSFVRDWAERNGCNMGDARRYLTNFENMIIEIMAMEKEVRFSFGVLGGRTIPAKQYLLFGVLSETPEKHGQPYYIPSKLAKE